MERRIGAPAAPGAGGIKLDGPLSKRADRPDHRIVGVQFGHSVAAQGPVVLHRGQMLTSRRCRPTVHRFTPTFDAQAALVPFRRNGDAMDVLATA